ncbi:seed maturation protein PM36, partial [Tanacetum coccineum]
CSSGISFIKSVDASSIESNAENLCNLFSEIVEMVGVKNVVQMVTDNGAVFSRRINIILS